MEGDGRKLRTSDVFTSIKWGKTNISLIAVLTTTWKVTTENDLGQTDVFKVKVLQEQSAKRPEESLLEKSTKIGGRIWGHSLLLSSYSWLGRSKNNDSLKNRTWGQKDKRQGTLKSFSFFSENIKKITSQHFLWDWFCKNEILQKLYLEEIFF